MLRPGLALLLLASTPPCAKAKPHIGNCGVSATADADISEAGPFNVGYESFPITYQPTAEASPRTITVNVWYPTHDTEGTPATYIGIFPDADSWVHASLAPPLSSCGYPTIEFSHGDVAWGGSSAYMMRHFASHGWVGIAPDHTGNTFADDANQAPHPTSLYLERSFDLMQSLDAVEHLPLSDPLSGKVALDHVLLVGHSYGTFDVWSMAGGTFDMPKIEMSCPSQVGVCTPAEDAVFAAGLRDPRIVAGIPEAGTIERSWFGPSGETGVHIPLLQMTGGDNDVGQYTNWPTLQITNISWIDIAGGCHETFNTGACQTLDADTGYKIVRTYQLAFARYHVLGDRSPLVTGIVQGTTQVSDLVTFQSK